MKKPSFLSTVQHFLPENRKRMWLWVGAVVASGVIAFIVDHRTSEAGIEAIKAEDPVTAATYIPAGHVLVPIEVANYESLDSILGKYGVVDLYTVPDDPKVRSKKVASKIKILRAPLNPSHFAVLTTESESTVLLGFSGPFTVVVQNPKSNGTEVVNPSLEMRGLSSTRARKKSSRITVEVTSAEIPTPL